MCRLFAWIASALIGASLLPAAAVSAPYEIASLGSIAGDESFGLGINAAGQVVGRVGGFAFIHDGTAMRMLGSEPIRGQAIDINDRGEIAGSTRIAGHSRPFRYDGLTIHYLDTLTPLNSDATAINAKGQVVGTINHMANFSPLFLRAFLHDGTSARMLDTLGGSTNIGWDINDSGHVVGDSTLSGDTEIHAFLYDGQHVQDIGTLGGSYSSASAINNRGQITGQSTLADGSYRAFLYHDNVMHDLGTLEGVTSVGRAINLQGQVIGSSWDAAGTQRGFLYSGSSGMVDLTSLLAPGSGWSQLFPWAINDSGQITGQGLWHGQPGAFLMTPTPEPSALALAAVAATLSAAAFCLRRRS